MDGYPGGNGTLGRDKGWDTLAFPGGRWDRLPLFRDQSYAPPPRRLERVPKGGVPDGPRQTYGPVPSKGIHPVTLPSSRYGRWGSGRQGCLRLETPSLRPGGPRSLLQSTDRPSVRSQRRGKVRETPRSKTRPWRNSTTTVLRETPSLSASPPGTSSSPTGGYFPTGQVPGDPYPCRGSESLWVQEPRSGPLALRRTGRSGVPGPVTSTYG